MKSYKLIKEYPCCLYKVGDIVELQKDKKYFRGKDSPYYIFKKYVENYPEFWEKVKKKKVEYQILSFSYPNSTCRMWENNVAKLQDDGNYHLGGLSWTLDSMLNKEVCVTSGHIKIHSVKRLIDGEIFTVGDTTNHNSIIKAIELGKGYGGLWFVTDEEENYGFAIGDMEIHIKEPLLITEDGVTAYLGDKYWCVEKNDKSKIFTQGYFGSGKIRTEEFYFFSSRESAEEYIIMNKPCLSINDVMCCYSTNQEQVVDNIIKLIKSRR